MHLRGRAATTWSWPRCIRKNEAKPTRKRCRTTRIDDVGRQCVHHLYATNANHRLRSEQIRCSFVCGGSSARQTVQLHPLLVGRRRRSRVEGVRHACDVPLRIRNGVIRMCECTTSEPEKLAHRIADVPIHPRRVGVRRFHQEIRRVQRCEISCEQRRALTTLPSQRRMQTRPRIASVTLLHDQVQNRNRRRWHFAAAQARGTSTTRRTRTKHRHHVRTEAAVEGT